MNKRDAVAIWNRACTQGPECVSLPGNRALAATILVHSLIMNGGVHHALEVLSESEMASGIEGYRYLNLTRVAAYLASIRDDPVKARWTEENELEANRCYYELVPDEEALLSAFKTVLGDRPTDFE